MKIERASLPLLDEPHAEAPVVCRLLRTKTAFGTMQPGGPDWKNGGSTTAVYWCLRTMETFGVDDRVAHAHTCVAGRRCFAKPVE